LFGTHQGALLRWPGTIVAALMPPRKHINTAGPCAGLAKMGLDYPQEDMQDSADGPGLDSEL